MAAVLYGPLVLCARTTKDNPVSVIHGDKNQVLADLKPVVGEVNTFTAPAAVFCTSLDKSPGSTTFVPFYKQYQEPYTVYWDIYDDARWAAKEAETKAAQEHQRMLDARRVDGLEFFDQAERDHNYKGEKSIAGDHNGRRWRHCDPGGWFQYELKVLADEPQVLTCSYWGSDGGRTFDIFVDDHKVATEQLKGEKPDAFFEREYPIAADLLKGKGKVTVKFQPVGNSQAGGVFGCYIMKSK